MTNMKQIGLALTEYLQDYDEKFPTGCVVTRTAIRIPSHSLADGKPAFVPGLTHGLGVGWAGSSYDYIKANGVFRCPDDPTAPTKSATGQTLYHVSYAMNQWIAGLSTEHVTTAATTVLAFECSGPMVNVTDHLESGSLDHSPVGDGASDPGTGIPDPGDGFDSATGRHQLIVNDQGAFARHDVGGDGGGGSFWLFADGHVKFLRFNQVSVGKQPVSQSKLGKKYAVSFNPVN